MTLSEQIDEILNYVDEGNYIGMSRDTPDLYRSAVRKMEAFGLIVSRGNTYDLTEKGHVAIEKGGYDNWRAYVDKQASESKPSISVGGNAVIGNNNSGVIQNEPPSK